MQDQRRMRVRQLASEYRQQGNATGWFEVLYNEAQGDERAIVWADMACNPNLLAWLEREQVRGEGRRALVVGCGLGDDAEELARRGFQVTAFDISPTAIAWCQRRFPTSSVTYLAADLLNAPEDWTQGFDFVFEAYTLQVLPPDLRARAVPALAKFVVSDGRLLIICRGREPEEDPGVLPLPLTRDDFVTFPAAGLHLVNFEDYFEQDESPTRRFRVLYQRS
ncbi:class I SAM-dependent methyltransferase [Ktedonospora formicarum]|uniref:Methyltransferase type 12 n=1 Tax=Ktedonospora formicarum TaxID=2778364 RepID=A0A8J3I6X2_9CHLR|nr:class I SAM-dependent methyltransferase [Ktedonospora formicarum]GHO45819.1 methyltransferase type 12 [Ktedonospora formicarum]